MKSLQNLSRGLSLALGLVLVSWNCAAADWQALNVQLLYSNRFEEPFNPNRVTKRIFTAEYTNGYSLGSNYAYVDVAKSGSQEVGALSGQPEAPLEFFGEWYHTLSFSKAFGWSTSVGPVVDLGLLAGVVAGVKSSEFRPETRAYVLGIEAALPARQGGFQTLSLSAYDDHSSNAFGDVSSRTTYRLAHCFGVPFTVGSIRGKVEGFWKLIGPTFVGAKTQFLAQPQVLFDVSPLISQKASTLFLGLEYQYYRNKFGTDAKESHPQVMVKWYL